MGTSPWRNPDATPTEYNGITFRSETEARVARHLDKLDVLWRYEEPTDHAVYYLPDFTIHSASKTLQLTRWVEVKPQQMLYDVRNLLDCPEIFDRDELIRRTTTFNHLRQHGLVELGKPAKLAAISKERILVVGNVDCDHTLSVTFTPIKVSTTPNIDDETVIVDFARNHPFVNSRGVHKRQEQERQRAENERRWQARQAEEQERRRREMLEHLTRLRCEIGNAIGRQAQWSATCTLCYVRRDPSEGLKFYNVANGRRIFLCGHCQAQVGL